MIKNNKKSVTDRSSLSRTMCSVMSIISFASGTLASDLGGGSQISVGVSVNDPNIGDTKFVHTHGRGDVVQTASGAASSVFPGSGTQMIDTGTALHARLRIRIAPESEYSIIDQTNGGSYSTGRVLWKQGAAARNNCAGLTIAYRHDTDQLLFLVGDSFDDGGGIGYRTRVWSVSTVIDDGQFRTIDCSYDELTGDARIWIDGHFYNPSAVVGPGGIQPAPELNGNWAKFGGSILGGSFPDGIYQLAGNGWAGVLGDRYTVWPDPNVLDEFDMELDSNTSVVGDVSYAAFRWAKGTDTLTESPWEVELVVEEDLIEEELVLVDNKSGLNGNDLKLLSGDHDETTPPVLVDAGQNNVVTRWIPTGLPTNRQQTRQLFVYHHGLGDQEITIDEYRSTLQHSNHSTTVEQDQIAKSIIMCMEPDGEIGYFYGYSSDQSLYPESDTNAKEYSIVSSSMGSPANGSHTFTLPAGKPGLYRIVVKSGAFVVRDGNDSPLYTHHEGFEFKTNYSGPYWGAYAPFGPLQGVSELGSTGYAYIPRDINPTTGNAYEIENGVILNTTLTDRAYGATSGTAMSSSSTFVNAPGIIESSLSAGWSIELPGMPFALSPDEFGAYHYIRGGVIEEENFTLWSLDEKILRDRIVEIASTGFGDPEDSVEDFGDGSSGLHAQHILDSPRDYYSLGTYPQGISDFNIAIHHQVVDTTQNMLGSIHFNIEAAGENPNFDSRMEYGEPQYTGNNVDQFGPAFLFWAGWDDVDANPYLNNAYIDKRARAAMLAFARHIQGGRLRRETRFENTLNPGLVGLAGTDELGIGMHWARVYSLFDSDDQAAFLPAALMQFCHVANNPPTTTRNQDAHNLPFLYEIGELWDDVNDETSVLPDWAEDYAKEIVEYPTHSSGEDVSLYEAEGFDGSYSGIQNYMIAAGWLVSGGEFDPTNSGSNGDYGREWDFLRVVLERQYEYWSHFMGSSPEGELITFGHDSDSRKTIGAVREQYNGAKELGALVNSIAARLALHDKTNRSMILRANSFGSTLAFPIVDSAYQKWTNNEPNPVHPKVGTKFDYMPIYAGGLAHLFDVNGDPIDTGAVLPSEVEVLSGVNVEEINEGFFAINTPCYYAVISTRSVGPYFYEEAIQQHRVARPIEDPSDVNGGGNMKEHPYIFVANSPTDDRTSLSESNSEELGGVGLSFFVDKTTGTGNSPLIVGRNWSPLTTHQLIGYVDATGSEPEERRWAEQNSRKFNGYIDPVNSDNYIIEICYDLNDGDTSTNTHGYRVERKYTFKPSSIDVDVSVYLSGTINDMKCDAISGTIETLDRLVENIPFELSESVIGTAARADRFDMLEMEKLPWGPQWDEWCATNWTGGEGLIYQGQEIGWLQKEIPVPTAGVPSVLSYTIEPTNGSCGSSPLLNQGGAQVKITEFVQAYERGDHSADLNQDGIVDVFDIQEFIGTLDGSQSSRE